ncbi:MAG: 2'-5' RNA ligase [Pseudohongiellaceae bacterium]
MALIRAFIGLSISELLERQLNLHAVGLAQQLANEDLRWVAPENYHITLAFMGDINPQAVPQIESLIEGVVAKSRRATLVIDDAVWFPSIHKPRLLVASLQQHAELVGLQSKLVNALRLEGFSVDHRHFKPHITLARAGRQQQAKKFQSVLSDLTTSMEEVVLFESQLRDTGPRPRPHYRPLVAKLIER